MQIIIVQAEIETAIRSYVLSQLNVKDGHRIDIDLSATRGADGFKATIDIVPEDAPEAAKQVAAVEQAPAAVAAVVKTAPAKKDPAPKEAAPVAAATAKEAAPVAAETVKQDAPVETGTASGATAEQVAGENAQEAVQEAAGTDAGDQATEGAATEEQPAAAPVKSLFAGLKRPVNTAS